MIFEFFNRKFWSIYISFNHHLNQNFIYYQVHRIMKPFRSFYFHFIKMSKSPSIDACFFFFHKLYYELE